MTLIAFSNRPTVKVVTLARAGGRCAAVDQQSRQGSATSAFTSRRIYREGFGSNLPDRDMVGGKLFIVFWVTRKPSQP